MTGKEVRIYTPAFRAEAVELVLEQELSLEAEDASLRRELAVERTEKDVFLSYSRYSRKNP